MSQNTLNSRSAISELRLRQLAAVVEHLERCAQCRGALAQQDRAALCAVGREVVDG